MFERRFISKADFNKTQTNILMMQIKAENHKRQKYEPLLIGTQKTQENTGKKVFREKLFQTTCLFRERSHSNISEKRSRSQRNLSRSVGKRMVQPVNTKGQGERSKGKKRIPMKQINHNSGMLTFSPKKSTNFTQAYRSGKRRYDHSPIQQNRLSPGFKILGNVYQKSE